MEKKQSIEAKSYFRLESKVVKYIENLYRLFVLTVLFIVTSLPVLTIGIAQISLYDSVKKLKEEPYNHPSSIFIQSVKNKLATRVKNRIPGNSAHLCFTT